MNGCRAEWVSVVLAGMGAILPGCTGEDAAGSGDLNISVSGGEAVREGFPHQEGTTTFAFADGWKVQFSKYVVALGNVVLTEPGSGSVTGRWDGIAVVDVKKTPSASLDVTTIGSLEAVRHDLAFDFPAVTHTAENRNAEQGDFDLMREQGWSMLVEGTGTHESKGTVRFRLGLPIQSHYYSCINGKDKTQGISVEASKTTGVFIYAHAMHVFWDSLATGDEDLRFDAFAAMKGDDDLVTEEELKGQDLNDLRDGAGAPLRDGEGHAIFYNDGGRLAPGRQNLYEFVLEAARGSAHFNGTGLCRRRDLGGQ